MPFSQLTNKIKKEYEYDFFGTVFIIDYKLIVATTLNMILGLYLLPPIGQMHNPENATYVLLVGALCVSLATIADIMFVKVKEGTEDAFFDFLDDAYDRFNRK
jgi:hypothetical protein